MLLMLLAPFPSYPLAWGGSLTNLFTPNQAIYGRQVDDPAAISRSELVLRQHLSNHVLTGEEGRLSVDCHGRVPPLLWRLVNPEGRLPSFDGDASVVNQSKTCTRFKSSIRVELADEGFPLHVDATVFCYCRLDHLLYLESSTHIRLDIYSSPSFLLYQGIGIYPPLSLNLWPCIGLKSTQASKAPSRAYAKEIARPSPDDDPVTMQTLFSRRWEGTASAIEMERLGICRQ